MRIRRLAWNTISSLFFQITALSCGFILSKLILCGFGSEVNGLVNSIMQFLQVVAMLDLGIGAVLQSSLYKPLAQKDMEAVSRVVVSGSKFFRRIAQILVAYVAILIFLYPQISRQRFGYVYTAGLILAISISSYAQYYFGIVDRLLLTADQRGYVQYIAQAITLIVNTGACAVMILLGSSIHMVKLITAIIFLIRPLVLHQYVNRHYNINRKISYEGEPIQQKWNGIAQHIAFCVVDGTDNIVLTLFSTLTNVSIYSIYHSIIYGVKNSILALTNGIKAMVGEMLAKNEYEALTRLFAKIEWLIHTGVVFIFGCTAVLIVPFVQVYTMGIKDANYMVPTFAVLLVLANAMHCLRFPYNILILAGGHYKQTQHNYIIAAILNIVISIVMVIRYGLVGVAIGTLIAMGYQTVWMAYYDSKNFINWPFRSFLKQLGVDLITVLLGVLATKGMEMDRISYASWFVLAVKTGCVWLFVILIVNWMFYKKNIRELFRS